MTDPPPAAWMGVPSGAQMSMPSCISRTFNTGSTRMPKPDTIGAPGTGYANDAVRGGRPVATFCGNDVAGAADVTAPAGRVLAVVVALVVAVFVPVVVAVVGREVVAAAFRAAVVAGALATADLGGPGAGPAAGARVVAAAAAWARCRSAVAICSDSASRASTWTA